MRDRREGKPNLGKRKADGSDSGGGGLQRAVKKLILDAQAVSPTCNSHSTPTDGSGISPSRSQPARLPDTSTSNGQVAQPSYMSLPTEVSHDVMAPQRNAQISNFPMGVSSAAMQSGPSSGAGQYGGAGSHDLSLDNVSLQSMLATYLPSTNDPPGGNGPDDFMNRVFEVGLHEIVVMLKLTLGRDKQFSWDGNQQNVDMPGEMDYLGFTSNQFQGWMG